MGDLFGNIMMKEVAMNIQEIKAIVQSSDAYNFLHNNTHLKNSLIIIGLGGSYAYGLNTSNSDLDIRGCALNSKEEILTYNDFEQVIDSATDTTIYSFNKLIKLLTQCNPNCVEILALKPEHYLYVSPVGQDILDNKKMFLSSKASHTFGGYAHQQLHRLKVKTEQTGRNKEAVSYNKLCKHMAHLVRLYYMCFDILECGEIITYREKEHDFLMDIRNGKYLDENRQPIPEFFEIVDELEKRMKYAKENTELPDKPDYDTINEFVMTVNEMVVKDEV